MAGFPPTLDPSWTFLRSFFLPLLFSVSWIHLVIATTGAFYSDNNCNVINPIIAPFYPTNGVCTQLKSDFITYTRGHVLIACDAQNQGVVHWQLNGGCTDIPIVHKHRDFQVGDKTFACYQVVDGTNGIGLQLPLCNQSEPSITPIPSNAPAFTPFIPIPTLAPLPSYSPQPGDVSVYSYLGNACQTLDITVGEFFATPDTCVSITNRLGQFIGSFNLTCTNGVAQPYYDLGDRDCSSLYTMNFVRSFEASGKFRLCYYISDTVGSVPVDFSLGLLAPLCTPTPTPSPVPTLVPQTPSPTPVPQTLSPTLALYTPSPSVAPHTPSPSSPPQTPSPSSPPQTPSPSMPPQMNSPTPNPQTPSPAPDLQTPSPSPIQPPEPIDLPTGQPISGSTKGATIIYENESSDVPRGAGQILYRITASVGDTIQITLCGSAGTADFKSFVALFTNNPFMDATVQPFAVSVVCGDGNINGSTVEATVPTTSRRTLVRFKQVTMVDISIRQTDTAYVLITGRDGEEGDYTMTPTVTTTREPPVADCFPAMSTVELDSGETKRMDQLQIGDRIHIGESKFSRVFFFSHRTAVSKHTFVSLSIADDHGHPLAELVLSKRHYIYVNGRMAIASSVQVGDSVILGNGTEARVSATTWVDAPGLYNPHTLEGVMLVDGVKVSCYTQAVHPVLAKALVHMVYGLQKIGVWDLFLKSFFDTDHSILASFMLAGSIDY